MTSSGMRIDPLDPLNLTPPLQAGNRVEKSVFRYFLLVLMKFLPCDTDAFSVKKT